MIMDKLSYNKYYIIILVIYKQLELRYFYEIFHNTIKLIITITINYNGYQSRKNSI